MIGVRSPFRVSFVGGGTDMPTFYRQQPGAVISVTINKFMYILVHKFFDEKIQIKYSRTELVDDVHDIQHPVVRVALEKLGIAGVDINSIADVPAGTGLGSSSAYTVTLLHALYAYQGKFVSKDRLAREACEIEIEHLGEPIGKQDQYATAYGGLNFMTFHPDETVQVEPVVLPTETYRAFEDSLMLFYLGDQREAWAVLKDQQENVQSDRGKFDALVRMGNLAHWFRDSLIAGDLAECGSILDESWQLKRQLSSKISSEAIDHYYDLGMANGATGGKLLGAGGGGFLAFLCPKADKKRLRTALGKLRHYPVKFENFGTMALLFDEHEVA